MVRKTQVLFFIAVAGILAGCAVPPQESIDAVQTALQTARDAGADEYAPDAMQLAEDAMSSAMTEVEAQNEKFAMFRSYTASSELLGKARSLADAAAAEASAAKERAKQDAVALIDQAQTAIDAALVALEEAPKGKGTQAELEAMRAEIQSLTAALDMARESFAGAKYLLAKSQAQSVADEANAIVADIQQAKTKVTT